MAEELTVPERIRLDPGTAAIIVIDAQNDFCHPEGLLARQGRDVDRVQEPLERLDQFLAHARAAAVPVFFIQNIHDDRSDSAAWRARHDDSDRAQSCQHGTWGAQFCQVAPHEGDVVITKHRYSAFIETDLKAQLEARGRRSLLFTGFTTSVCVETSLRDAVCHDFLATLVEDCCGAYSERAHQRAVEGVSLGFGLVSTSDRVTAAWSERLSAGTTSPIAPNPPQGASTR